jgi:hypothetical protein
MADPSADAVLERMKRFDAAGHDVTDHSSDED